MSRRDSRVQGQLFGIVLALILFPIGWLIKETLKERTGIYHPERLGDSKASGKGTAKSYNAKAIVTFGMIFLSCFTIPIIEGVGVLQGLEIIKAESGVEEFWLSIAIAVIMLLCISPLIVVIAWYYEGQPVPNFLVPYFKDKLTVARERQDVHAIQEEHARLYVIYPPRQKLNPVNAEKLIKSLLGQMPHLTFRVVAQADSIVWEVRDVYGRYNQKDVEGTLKAYMGKATVIEVFDTAYCSLPTTQYPYYRDVLYFTLANDYAAPLPMADSLPTFDPLQVLTERMSQLDEKHNERFIYEVHVYKASQFAGAVAGKRYREGNVLPLKGVPAPENSMRPALDARTINKKINDDLYHCIVTVTVESTSKTRLSELRSIASDVAQFHRAGYNQLVQYTGKFPLSHPEQVTDEDRQRYGRAESRIVAWETFSASWRNVLTVLSPSEIATLWHLPAEHFDTDAISWAVGEIPEPLLKQTTGSVAIGTGSVRGTRKTAYIAARDRNEHHLIVGATGTGKSTLIHNLIQQDIERGDAVALISPHGQLISDIVRSQDTAHISRVVPFHAGNTDTPIPLNPFCVPDSSTLEETRSIFLWALEHIYSDIQDFARMRRVLGHVLDALLADPEATPRDVLRVFLDEEYRDHILHLLATDTSLSSASYDYWNTEYPSLNESHRRTIAEPILSRTGVFRENRALEMMTGYPQSLDVQQLITTKSATLFDLSGSQLSSDARKIVTVLLISRLLAASQTLGAQHDHTPRLYLYIDEAEEIMTDGFSKLLSQIRKFGVSVTLATQHLDQLEPKVFSSVMGNVSTKFVFRVGSPDAKRLAPYFGETVEADSLVRLDDYHMAVSTLANGKMQKGFIVETNNRPDHKRQSFTATHPDWLTLTSRGDIEAWAEERYTSKPKQSTRRKKQVVEKYD